MIFDYKSGGGGASTSLTADQQAARARMDAMLQQDAAAVGSMPSAPTIETPEVTPGQYLTVEDFDAANPTASATHRAMVEADILRTAANRIDTRSAWEQAADIGLSAVGSAMDTTLGTLANLGTLTGTEASYDIARSYNSMRDSMREYESDVRKNQRAFYQGRMEALRNSDEYKAMGDTDKISAEASLAYDLLGDNLAVLEDIGIAGIADIATTITGAGALAKGAAKYAGSKAAKELGEEAASEAGQKAIKEAQRTAIEGIKTKGALGVEAAQTAGSAVGQVNQEIDKLDLGLIKDNPTFAAAYNATEGTEAEKEQAGRNALKDEVNGQAAVLGAVGSAAIGKLTGAGEMAGDIATKGMLKGLTEAATDTAGKQTIGGLAKKAVGTVVEKSPIGTALKEGAEEALQSGGEVALANALIDQNDIAERDIVEGVGEAAVQGVAGGTIAGGAVGAMPAAVSAAEVAAKTGKVIGKVAVGTAKIAAMPFTKKAKEAEQTETPPPSAELTQAAEEFQAKADTPTISARMQELVSDAKQVFDVGTAYHAEVSTLDPDATELGDLLERVATVKYMGDQLKTNTMAALDSGELSEEEAGVASGLLERLNKQDSSTMYAEVGKLMEASPRYKATVDATLTAMLTGDSEGLDNILAETVAKDLDTETKAALRNVFVGGALFSKKVFEDDTVTPEQLTGIMGLTNDPVLKGQAKAMAQVKGASAEFKRVAGEILTGNRDEFIGITNHLDNLKSQLASGEATDYTLSRLANFAKVKRNKYNAVADAVARQQAGEISFPHTVTYETYNGTGSFEVRNSKFLELFNAEASVIEDAYKAANVLLGNESPESILTEQEMATTPPAKTAPAKAPPVKTENTQQVREGRAAAYDAFRSEARKIYNSDFVQNNPELKAAFRQEMDAIRNGLGGKAKTDVDMYDVVEKATGKPIEEFFNAYKEEPESAGIQWLDEEETTPEPEVTPAAAPEVVEAPVVGPEVDIEYTPTEGIPEVQQASEEALQAMDEDIAATPEAQSEFKRNERTQAKIDEGKAAIDAKHDFMLEQDRGTVDYFKKSLASVEARMAAEPENEVLPGMVQTLKERVAEAEAKVQAGEAAKQLDIDKLEYQEDLGQLDWPVDVLADAMDTESQQIANYAEDALGLFVGTPEATLIEQAQPTIRMKSLQSIRNSLKDMSKNAIFKVLDYLKSEMLPKTKVNKDKLNALINSNASLAMAAPNSPIRNTVASLQNLFKRQHMGLQSINRFKKGVIGYRPSKLWENDNYLLQMVQLGGETDATIANALKDMGIDTKYLRDADYAAIRQLQDKYSWFMQQMGQLNRKLIDTLKDASLSDAAYSKQALKNLLDGSGNFPAKVLDAAFLAYIDSLGRVSASKANTPTNIALALGLSDKAQLADIAGWEKLLNIGTLLRPEQSASAFKRALGWKHSKDVPNSVMDTVYSAMGGMLHDLMFFDPELDATEVSLDSGLKYYGMVLNKPEGMPSGNSFLHAYNSGNRFLAQLTEGHNGEPSNYIGVKPPITTARDTHLRSSERLHDKQIEANNIYSQVEHEVEPTVATFVDQIGLEGFKLFQGYVDQTEVDKMNVDHATSVNGDNQQILYSYETAREFLDNVKTAEDKTIYFAHEFTSVGRQQMKGAVNPVANKFHRALIGHKNTATVARFNLTTIDGRTLKASNALPLVLALGQALGVKVDKQGNLASIKDTGARITKAYEEYMSGEGLYAELATNMDSEGNFISPPNRDTLLALRTATKGEFHAVQGILTMVRMFKASKDGVVTNFKHHMRIEVDGLTNGPAHATFLAGLAGMTEEEKAAALLRGGYITGDATGRNVHQQIAAKTLTDTYLKVRNDAQKVLEAMIADAARAAAGSPTGMYFSSKHAGETFQRTLKYLTSRGIALGINDDTGEIELVRNDTKNPVTVTVYGGGANGIQRKMASAMRNSFSEQLTELAAKYEAKQINFYKLTEALSDAQWAVGGHYDKFDLISQVKGAREAGTDIPRILRKFTFDTAAKEATVKTIGTAYGDAVMGAIDSVFASNKRTGEVMNTALNYITAVANQLMTEAYTKLWEKRVQEGTITEYDTLSSADIGKIQRAVEKALPYVRTAVGHVTDVSNKGEEGIANKGTGTVAYPTLKNTKSGVQSTQVEHSSKSLGLPGVRGIPVLTISVDAAVQVENHLLQGHNANYLNVYDAIDYAASDSVRAGNEVFNMAEYMGLMGADTLQTVTNAFRSMLQSQAVPLTVEGVTVEPLLARMDMSGEYVTADEEIYRNALQGNYNEIAKSFGVSPLTAGDTKAFLQYLLVQLDAETVNSRKERYAFAFGNDEVSINQMAGIDGGHARIAKGQIQPTEEAKALLGADGLARIEAFNQTMAKRYKEFQNGKYDSKPNAPLMAFRDGDKTAREHVARVLSKLEGPWQDLRATANLDTAELVFDLSDTGNRAKFLTNITKQVGEKESIAGSVKNALPTVSAHIFEVLNTSDVANLRGMDNAKVFKDIAKGVSLAPLDAMLKKTIIRLSKDMGEGIEGMYEYVDGKHVITMAYGMSVADANRVLSHELIHAATKAAIENGIRDPENHPTEAALVASLESQANRALRNPHIAAHPRFQQVIRQFNELYTNAAQSPDPAGLRALALSEFIAELGSLSAEEAVGFFLEEKVKLPESESVVLNFLHSMLGVLRNYLVDMFGGTRKNSSDKSKEIYAQKEGKRYGEDSAYYNAVNSGVAGEYSEHAVLAAIFTQLSARNKPIQRSTPNYSVAVPPVPTNDDGLLDGMRKVTRAAEDAINEPLKKMFNLGVTIVARQLAKTEMGKKANLHRYVNMKPEARVRQAKAIVEAALIDTDTNTPMGALQGIAAEFVSRDKATSQIYDRHNDIAQYALDSTRQSRKQTVITNIREHFGQMGEPKHKAVTNVILKADGLSLGATRLAKYLGDPKALRADTEALIRKLMNTGGVSKDKRIFMVNEARALGYRSVKGGATAGYNLPNAKSIVHMVGTSQQPIDDPDGSIQSMVDELATLEALSHLSSFEKSSVAIMLEHDSKGVDYLKKAHDALKRDILRQYGSGYEYSLPKGYLPEQNNPNHSIRVVPKADVNKYPGFEFVRAFKRDALDRDRDREMVIIRSKEGGTLPFVQAGLSTVESAIGGFTTKYGRALDGSLPSISGNEARAVAKAHAAQWAMQTGSLKAPVTKREGLIPNVNSVGVINGYRYAIPTAERDTLLDNTHDVAEVLGSYYGRVGEQRVAAQHNAQLAEHLYNHWKDNIKDPNYTGDMSKDFIKVSAQHPDKRISELWRVIPEGTKDVLKEKFGGNFVMVHKRDLDNVLGYREASIANWWNQPDGSFRKATADIIDEVMGPNTVNRLRWIERALQESVVTAKDLIVVKSVVVPAANIVSNLNHLMLRDVPVDRIWKDGKEGAKALREFKADMKELRTLILAQDIEGTPLQDKIDALQLKVRNNPISFMVEEGMLSTVVADVDGDIPRGSIREQIARKIFPEGLFKEGNGFIDTMNNVLINKGSTTYQFLADALESGDFTAKYVLIKHLMREGKSKEEAILEARTEFVNYNTLSSSEMDYLNKTGGTFFYKYFARIQPVIMRAIARNPTSALVHFVGANAVGTPSVFDAMFLDKNYLATTGAYDLLNIAGGAHPLTAL